MPSRDFTVTVPGGTLSGRDFGGTGQDVILLHSVGYSVDTWAEFAPRLAEFCRVVMFDMRGHGQSACEINDPLELVRDIPRVADALGMTRPLVVAHMWGGGVASILAKLEPDFMGGLCLIDGPATDTQANYRDLLHLFATDAVLKDLTDRVGLGRRGVGRESYEAFIDEMARSQAKDWLSMASGYERARATVSRVTRVDADGSWVRRPTIEGLVKTMLLDDDVFAHPGRELLEDMTAPVWALQPQDGDYSRGFAAFAQLAQERPGWEARVLPGAMHVMHTHREEVLEHLREMLATMREPAPAS